MGATLRSVCHTGIYDFPFYREATMPSLASNPGGLFLLCYSLWEKKNKLHMASSIPVPDLMFTSCVG